MIHSDLPNHTDMMIYAAVLLNYSYCINDSLWCIQSMFFFISKAAI